MTRASMGLLLGCLLGCLALTGCATATGSTETGQPVDAAHLATEAAPPSALPGQVVWLGLAGPGHPVLAPGAVVADVPNAGDGSVRTEITTSAGGRITRGTGPAGEAALRFPAYVAQGQTPAAVLIVRPQGTPDPLSPGTRPFELGADVNLDPDSSGSATDNGDNVLQRGLFSDPAQYKLQLDHGVASCRIAGASGEALVSGPAPIDRGRWYRLSCRRSGDQVTLTQRPLAGGGDEQVATVTAPTGRVEFPSGVPLTAGGKVSAAGDVTVSETDQFNGLMDGISLRLLE